MRLFAASKRLKKINIFTIVVGTAETQSVVNIYYNGTTNIKPNSTAQNKQY